MRGIKKVARLLLMALCLNMLSQYCYALAADTDNMQYPYLVGLLTSAEIVDSSYLSMHPADGHMGVSETKKIISGNIFEEEKIDYSPVTVGIAVKEVVKKLGYDKTMLDGYTDIIDFFNKARTLKLLNGINAGVNDYLTCEDFAKLLVNMLETASFEFSGEKNGGSVYQTGLSYFREKNIFESTGIVEQNVNTSLYEQAGTDDNKIIIDGIRYQINDDTIHSYLGKNVRFYYQKKSGANERIILSLTENRLNKTVTIDAADLSDATDTNRVVYYNENKEITLKLDEEYSLIYNGIMKLRHQKQDLLPELGRLEVIDNDNDGVYEVVFVYSYEVYIVSEYSLSNRKVVSANDKESIKLDNPDSILDVVKNGEKSSVSEIKKDDVLYVAFSEDKNHISIVISDTKISGVIERLDLSDDKECLIDGKWYKVGKDVNLSDAVGKQGIFRLGADGVIEYAEFENKSDYAFILGVDRGEHFSKPKIRLAFFNGEVKDFELADKAYLYSTEYDKRNIKNAELDVLSEYARGCIEAPAPSLGAGKAAPVVMYTTVNGRIKTISLPTTFDSEKMGSERTKYTLQSATENPEMLDKISRNLYKRVNRSVNPVSASNLSDGAVKFVDDNTKIVEIPVNSQMQIWDGFEKQIKVYSGKDIGGDWWFYGSFYNLNDNYAADLMIKYVSSYLNVDYYSSVIVKSVGECLKNGEVYKFIEGICNGKDVELIVSEDVEVNTGRINEFNSNITVTGFNDLKNGDLLLVSKGVDDVINYIQLIFRADTDITDYKLHHNGNGPENEFEAVFGKVIKKSDNLIAVSVDTNAYDPNIKTCLYSNYGGANIYVFEDERNSVYSAKASEISKNDYVYIVSYDSDVTDIIVIQN